MKNEETKKAYDALRMEQKNPKTRQTGGGGGASGYDGRTKGYDPFANARRDGQKASNGNFYGRHKTRDDFYKHYTGFDTQDAKSYWR